MTWITFAFERMFQATWQAGLLILLILIAQAVLREQLSPRWRCALWTLVFVRLCLPMLPSSPLSLQNLVRDHDPSPIQTFHSSGETVTFGVISDQAPNTIAIAPYSAPAPTSPISPMTWKLACAFAWLTIALALLIWTLARSLALNWRIRGLAPTSNPRLIAAMQRAEQEASIGYDLDIIETSLVTGPALAGIARSRLLIPPGLADRLDDEQLRFVLLHELAHHRRWDVPMAVCASLIACVHWFNPMVWLAVSRFRNERELACDAFVLARTRDEDRPAYGQTILGLIEMLGSARPTSLVASMLPRRRSIHRRIQGVANYRTPRASWTILSIILLLALACGTLTGATHSTNPTTTTATPTTETAPTIASDSQSITRIYDVRDLLITIPNFDDAPDLTVFNLTSGRESNAPKPAAAASSPAPTHKQALLNLERIIMDEVDSASWRDRGGSIGSIQEMPNASGKLVITQTPANQDAIQRLFQDRRSAASVQVTVEARFITGKGAFARLRRIAGDKRWESAGQYQLWPGYLSDEQAKLFVTTQQLDKDSKILSAPRITLFNRQRAYVLVDRASAFVSWFQTNSASTKPIGFNQQISIAHSGFLLDCAATASADRKAVAIVLRPQWTVLEGFTSKRWPASPPGRDDLIVQVPHMRIVNFKATTSIPNGQTAVFRIRPKRQPASTTQRAPEPVMLLVKPTITQAIKSAKTSGHPGPS